MIEPNELPQRSSCYISQQCTCSVGSNVASHDTHSPSFGRHLLTNVCITTQLDVSNTTSQFGMEVYGSGQPTGIVADSGSLEVCIIDWPALGCCVVCCADTFKQ